MIKKAHQALIQKYSWYNSWHKHPYHQHAHWGIFGITSAFLTKLVIAALIGGFLVNPAFAANKTWTSQADWEGGTRSNIDTTTSAGDIRLSGQSGGGDLQFDGSNDYVSVPDSSDYNFGSSNFSIEFWTKWNTTPGDASFIGQSNGGGDADKWGLIYNAVTAGKLVFHTNTGAGSTNNVEWTWSPVSNTWYHVAVTRSSNSWYLFVNGVQTGGTQTASFTVPNPSSDLRIGTDGESWKFLPGEMDEVRISSTARYTAAFAPSTTLADVSNTVGLWHFDAGTGQTVADDTSVTSRTAHDGTRGTNSSVGTDDPTWYFRSAQTNLVFDDSNDYVTIDNESNFDLERTNSFTLEAWIKTSNTANDDMIVAKEQNSGNYVGYYMMSYNSGGAHTLGVILQGTTSNYVIVRGSTVITDGKWHHVAMSYSGTSNAAGVKLFVDGSLETMTTESDSLGTNTLLTDTPVTIGSRESGGVPFNGSIDEVRISNNARYSSGFTPSQTLSTDGNTLGLWHLDAGAGQAVADSSGNSNNGNLGSSSSVQSSDPMWATINPYTSAGTDTLTYDSGASGTSWSNLSWAGVNGSYLKFDGGDVVTPSSNPSTSTTFTAEQWFYNSEPSGNHYLWTHGTYYWAQVYQSHVRIGISGGGGTYGDSTTIIQPNQWYHIAVTYNGTTMKLFINGVEDMSANWGSQVADGFTIGASSHLGGMREFRLSNTVRYTGSFTPSYMFTDDADTALLYHMTEGSGQTVADDNSTSRTAYNGVLGANSGSSTDDPTWVAGTIKGRLRAAASEGALSSAAYSSYATTSGATLSDGDLTGRYAQVEWYLGGADSTVTPSVSSASATYNSTPSVSSLSPASGAATTDTTPTLSYTSADADSDQVTQRIQVDDSSDFGSPVVDFTTTSQSAGSKSFTVGQDDGDAGVNEVQTITANDAEGAVTITPGSEADVATPFTLDPGDDEGDIQDKFDTAYGSGNTDVSGEVPSTAGTVTMDANTNFSTFAFADTSSGISHTIGSGSDQMLVVRVVSNSNVIGVTWDGNAMTQITGSGSFTSGPSTITATAWYIATPTQGTHSVVLTRAATGGPPFEFTGSITSFNDTNGSMPSSIQTLSSDTSGTPNRTVSSATGSFVLDVIGAMSSFGGTTIAKSGGAEQTVQQNASTPMLTGGTSYKAGDSSVNIGWTTSGSNNAAMMAFSVDAVSGSSIFDTTISVAFQGDLAETDIDEMDYSGDNWQVNTTTPGVANTQTGTYTVGTNGQTLSQGSYYWRVKAIDSHTADSGYTAANSGAVAFIVDTSAPSTPSITSPTNGATITDTTPTLTGSAFSDTYSTHASSKWQVDTASNFNSGGDGPQIDSGTDTSNKTSYTTTTLSEGLYYARVLYTDAAGNPSSYSSTISFTIDTSAPNAPTVSAPSGATTVNAASYNVQGTAEANALVTVYTDPNNDGNQADGASAGTQQLTGGGTSYSISVTLSQDAANNFVVTAKDALANESSATNVPTITEDSTAPGAPIISTPSSPTTVNAATYDIQGTAEANSLVTIYKAGVSQGTQQLTGGGTSYSITVSLSQNATNTFTAKATDAASNESSGSTAPTITEDSNAPSAPTITAPSGNTTVNAATYNVTGTAEANSLVTVYTDPNNDGNQADGASAGTQQLTGGGTSFSISVSLTQDAANNFVATAIDAASNESTAANVPTITEDSTGPSTPVVSAPSGTVRVNAATYDIQGTAEANSLVTVYKAGVSQGNQQLTGGDTSYSITVSLTQDAANNFTVKSKDASDNESSAASVPTITEDSTAPGAPTGVSVTRGSSLGVLEISWTNSVASDFDHVVLYRSTVSSFTPGDGDSTTVTSTSSASYSNSSLSNATTYYYRLVSVDTTGNVSSATTAASATTHAQAQKLLVKLPGQSFSSGSGISGSATTRTAGSSFTISVYATDNSNREALLATNSVTITSADTQAVLPSPAAMVSGTKDFTVTLKTAGTMSITAAASGLTSGSANATVQGAAASASTSSLVASDTSPTVGDSITLTATIKDEYGNALSGKTVVLDSSRDDDTVTQPSGSTNVSGVAIGSLETSSAGSSTVTATVSGVVMGTDEVVWEAADEEEPTPGPTDEPTPSEEPTDEPTAEPTDAATPTPTATTSATAATTTKSTATPKSTAKATPTSTPTATALASATPTLAATTTPVTLFPLITTPRIVATGQAFRLKASEANKAKISSYLWSFSDKSFSREAEPTFVFQAGLTGNQVVTLTLTDAQGNTASTSSTIFVTLPQPQVSVAVVAGQSLLVQGSTQPNAVVVLFVLPGNTTEIVTADAQGNYEGKISLFHFNQGSQSITAVATASMNDAQTLKRTYGEIINSQLAHAANGLDNPRVIAEPKIVVINQNYLSILAIGIAIGLGMAAAASWMISLHRRKALI